MKKRKKLYILLVLIFLIFILLIITIQDDRKLSKTEIILKDLVLNLSNIITFNYKNNNAEKINYSLEYNEILDENNKLKELLELNKTLTDYEFINASVININTDEWFKELTINKGSSDGVEENMAVINNKGLIGITMKVSKKYSVVKLITDFQDKISVKIESNNDFVYGLINNYNDGYFYVDGISSNNIIEKNSKIYTSGLTQKFPSGILIGTVEEILKDNFEMSRILKVKPIIDINKLYFVSVLKVGAK